MTRSPLRPAARGLALLALAACASLPPRGPAASGVVFPSPYLQAILSEPAGYDSTRAWPLLVALHGYGDTAAGFAQAFAAGSWTRCFVAIPEAETPLATGGTSWYPLTADRARWPALDGHAVAAVVALVDALRARYRIGPVYLLGFSQGAMLAYQVGLLHPERVAGIVAIAGRAPDVDTLGAIVHAADLTAARAVRLLVARGRDDAAVPRRVFTAQAAFFAARGFAVTRVEFAGGHDLPAEIMERVSRWLRETPGR